LLIWPIAAFSNAHRNMILCEIRSAVKCYVVLKQILQIEIKWSAYSQIHVMFSGWDRDQTQFCADGFRGKYFHIPSSCCKPLFNYFL